jgi:ABC-type sugar transport system substrate-binding protein
MKKKVVTRVMAVSMAALMCASFGACGNQQSASTSSSKSSSAAASSTKEESKKEEPAASSSSSSSSAATPSASEEFETGLTVTQNSFLAGDYAFSCIANVGKIVVEGSGNKFVELSDNADINQVQADVENMINAQTDGALWWGVLDPYYQVGPGLFNDAMIPFAFFDCVPSPESGLQEQIDEMEYYAGSAASDNATFGAQMAEKALEDGCKHAIVFANEIGSSVAVRAEAFQEVFEAGGGEVLEISHVSTTANAHVEATQNMIATYPDVDCIYGVSVDFVLGAYTVTKGKDVKLYATDASPEAINYLLDGSIQGLNGGHFVVNYLAAALLLNTMDGHRIEDNGKPLNLVLNPVVITPENAELYIKFWIDGDPYSYDDIKYLLYRENPEVTAQDYYDFVDNYSIESVVAMKVAQGLCTEEEAKKAGIEL